tara:strand:- start:77 stop:520 length:444 start_codon:yes stop_codon:yes gene_type:complete
MDKRNRNILIVLIILILLFWKRNNNTKQVKEVEDDGQLYHFHHADFCFPDGSPSGASSICNPCQDGVPPPITHGNACYFYSDSECTSLAECEAKSIMGTPNPFMMDRDAYLDYTTMLVYWLDEDGVPYGASWYGWEYANLAGMTIQS